MITIMATDDIANRRGALPPGDHKVRPLTGIKPRQKNFRARS